MSPVPLRHSCRSTPRIGRPGPDPHTFAERNQNLKGLRDEYNGQTLGGARLPGHMGTGVELGNFTLSRPA